MSFLILLLMVFLHITCQVSIVNQSISVSGAVTCFSISHLQTFIFMPFV